MLFRTICGATAVALSVASSASAQCTGDCNGSGDVTVDELVVGVNIALGNAMLDACPAFDSNHDDSVTIDELISAVKFALNECPAATPTPPVPTPTPSPKPSVSATIPPGCGNGTVDFNLGETCDDGNNVDDDGPNAVGACPANCRVALCSSSGGTSTASINVTPPGGTELAGATIFVRYPDGVVGIPGSANDDSVLSRLSDLPGNAFVTPNDLDFAVRVVLVSTDQLALSTSPLFSIDFDTCAGAAAATVGQFTCIVEDAADTALNKVTGATCSVALH
ncbi:MAG: hypothetical protein HY270_07780 [Deltaproteobacteria bacterium]|nr:hypothetical protein [Deltaproteobacteria bacterium]